MTTDNQITEDYCSFELAKLLKEKGFNISGNSGYNFTGEVADVPDGIFNNDGYKYVIRPTYALAIKWVRTNYGLHIYADYNSLHKWFYCILDLKDEGRIDASRFNSPEEAIEAALLYALQHNIETQTITIKEYIRILEQQLTEDEFEEVGYDLEGDTLDKDAAWRNNHFQINRKDVSRGIHIHDGKRYLFFNDNGIYIGYSNENDKFVNETTPSLLKIEA